jgi:preprotein translocase subunit SecG
MVAPAPDARTSGTLVAGTLALTNVSDVAKRVSFVLFALFFLMFLALMGFAHRRRDRITRA